eukprot:TRINITY_DN9608_c0_g1_i1.p2 TRINITY_DN9608_c0_g1~~TRINITY_DN9608_c0_g1_i1.p2  ORF type:complete len:167 (+),score=7.16 TRINITY_DN9608_c0_g1_i1:645-1145(+)
MTAFPPGGGKGPLTPPRIMIMILLHTLPKGDATMDLMQWDEAMSVGVEELDAQHRQLIQLINEAYKALQMHDEQRMTSLIGRMRDYAVTHFATAEEYLKKYGYPELESHKFQHAKFNETVKDFKEKMHNKTNLSKIFVFLSRWLASHIMETDMQYVPYMPKKDETD